MTTSFHTRRTPAEAFTETPGFRAHLDAGGNVWDWTSSLFEPHVQASASRVFRGGSWLSPVENARAANRAGFTPEYRSTGIGFRPARSVTS